MQRVLLRVGSASGPAAASSMCASSDATRAAISRIDGEHRALGRLAHRRVGALGRARHRGADQHRVDELARARDQLLGGAADELGEDDAAVAARAEQRGAGDRLDDLVAADLVDRALLGGAAGRARPARRAA